MPPTVLRQWSWCFSYLVWLCGFYYGAFHVEFCLALCSRVFAVLFGIVIISLGEERAGLCVSRARISFCTFSLPLGVSWLWLVVVALPALFY